ncbi:MAG TPA: aldo/keto reductase [Xanthobacteraceae bacterium]|jgi:aryl-alcohol dehydrogenase-like predicted oxidoreductase|nr:aldo/keto reductase [Xanthobacteraceae bacterium]
MFSPSAKIDIAAGWPRFTLGTVQFGYAYGLARTRVGESDVGETLARAWDYGVDTLDTAPAYGASERIIGAERPAHAAFAMVTKTVALRVAKITQSDVDRVVDRARQSAADLRVNRLEAILVHESEDLLSAGSDLLIAGLRRLRAEGLVGRIGVSVYDPHILDTILERHDIDVVQLPLNVLDQRFARSGHIERLAGRGIEVHSRSVFLQGLLLQELDSVPPQFASASNVLARFRTYAASLDMSPLEAAILFAGSVKGVSRLVVGIDSVASLATDLKAMAKASVRRRPADFSSFAIDDPVIIDPRRWKAKNQ